MTNQFRLSSIVCAVVFALVATPRGGPSDSPDELAVRKVLSGIIAADNAGDLDAVIASYAEDVIFLPPNDTAVVGKLAIRARYEQAFRRLRLDIAFAADDTRICDDWAFIQGTINGRTIPKGDEPSRKIHDKYITVLQHSKEGWKIARLIWNSVEPPVPASS